MHVLRQRWIKETGILYQKPEGEIEKRNNSRKQMKVDYEIMKRIIGFEMPRYRDD